VKGDPVREDDIARPGDRIEDARHPVLATIHHDEPVRIVMPERRCEPACESRTHAQIALGDVVVLDHAEPVMLRQHRQQAFERVQIGIRRRTVDRQVAQPCGFHHARARRAGTGRADIAAATYPAFDMASLLKHLEGPRHRRNIYTQYLCEVPERGQSIAICQFFGLDE